MHNCICVFLIIYITNSGKNDMKYLSCKSISFWSNNFFQVCKEAKKGGCTLFYLLTKREPKEHMNVSPWNILFLRSSIFEHCSSTLPWGLKQAYTFSKVFKREDWTAPQTDSWGRKSWGALAIMIYLEDLQQLQKVLQAILKHRKRTLLEGYAGISETTILFYIC